MCIIAHLSEGGSSVRLLYLSKSWCVAVEGKASQVLASLAEH